MLGVPIVRIFTIDNAYISRALSLSELQIKGGFEDNSKLILLFLNKNIYSRTSMAQTPLGP